MSSTRKQMDDPKITLAKAKLTAAQLRTRAAHQEEQAAMYRKAAGPLQGSQADNCNCQAAIAEALAAENRAKAGLIEAEAEAAFRCHTQID
jgi:hypothetical protein